MKRAGVPSPRRPSKQAGSIRENRARLREPVHKDRGRRHQDRSDDAGNGGHASQRTLHPDLRQDHKLESDAGGGQQYLDSQPTPMQLGTNPKIKGKGTVWTMEMEKARTSRGKARARMHRTNLPRKQRATIRESASSATKQVT